MTTVGHNSKRAGSCKPFIDRLIPLYNRQIAIARLIDAATGHLAEEMGLPQVKTYVVQGIGTDLVKIGRSGDIKARLRSLQGGSPNLLKIIRSIPFDCERRMHVRFAHLRRHGEWFSFDLDMLTETFHEDIVGQAKAALEAA